MKKWLFSLMALGCVTSMSLAEMKCAPGKCGGGKCAASMKASDAPKTVRKMFQSVSKDKAMLVQSGKEKASCVKCGMHLPMFFKTNHVTTVAGKAKQYCSIHCLAEVLQSGAALKDIKVVDTNHLKFIDATKASYVVGSRKKGTMSRVSKYAFSSKTEAEAFAKEYGGEVVGFKAALKVAKDDFK